MELLYYTTFCKICLLNRKRMPVKSGNPTNISAINRQNEQLPVSVYLIGMEHCLIVSHIKDIRVFLGFNNRTGQQNLFHTGWPVLSESVLTLVLKYGML